MIKIILIVGMLIAVSLYFFRLRNQLRDRVIALGIFACVVVFVLFPDLTQSLAHIVGIGRGADLIFYFSVLGLLYLFIVFDIRMKEKERQITELTRAIALITACHDKKTERTSEFQDV